MKPSLTLVIFLLSSMGYAQQKIHLAFPEFPPFTQNSQKGPSGIGIDLVKKVMQDLNVQMTLAPAPNYDRALMTVVQNKADGFFLGTKNASRDKVAVLTEPVVMNRWCWFSIDGQVTVDKTQKIGTIMNTNTHKWLDKNGYQSYGLPSSTSLVFQLVKKRLKTTFLAEMAFLQAAKEQKVSQDRISMKVQREKPFGIYISKVYLKSHPDFMAKLNTAIKKHQQLGHIRL